MSVGYVLSKQVIDTHLGTLSVAIIRDIKDGEKLHERLIQITDSDLIALGYTAADVTQLRDTTFALSALSRVADGRQAQVEANNFLLHPSRVIALS